jgi:hypothetical protein
VWISILEMISFENVDDDSEAQQSFRRIRKPKTALPEKESQRKRDRIKVNHSGPFCSVLILSVRLESEHLINQNYERSSVPQNYETAFLTHPAQSPRPSSRHRNGPIAW